MEAGVLTQTSLGELTLLPRPIAGFKGRAPQKGTEKGVGKRGRKLKEGRVTCSMGSGVGE